MCLDLNGISRLRVRPDYHPLLLNKWGRVNYNVVQALQGSFTLPQLSSQGFEKLMNWDEVLEL